MFARTEQDYVDAIGPHTSDITADEFVQQRDQEHDAQRLRDDLASAPATDRKLLTQEEERLGKLEAAMNAARAAATAARTGIVDARVAGKPDEPARAVAAKADQVAFEAMKETGLQRDVVSKLRERILSAVKADRESRARAKQADARERWDAALSRIVPAFDGIEALRQAHALDLEAADEWADIRGEWRHHYDEQGLRQRVGPNGGPHVTTPEPTITIALDGETILTAGELVARLRV